MLIADLVTISRNSAWARARLLDSPQTPAKTTYRMALDLYSNPGLRQAREARRSHAHQRSEFVNIGDSGFSSVVANVLEEIEMHPPAVLTSGPLCGSR